MLNAQNSPCRDRRVRQALNYTLDVDAIIAGFLHVDATRLNAYLTAHQSPFGCCARDAADV